MTQFYEGNSVLIEDAKNEYNGQIGKIIYLPDYQQPWFEIEMSDGETAVVYEEATMRVVDLR